MQCAVCGMCVYYSLQLALGVNELPVLCSQSSRVDLWEQSLTLRTHPHTPPHTHKGEGGVQYS